MQALQKSVRAPAKTRPVLALNTALSFVAGYTDAVGFLALFGLFTAHITGNLVLLSAEIATPEHTFPILKMLALPAFITGVALAKLLASLCQRKKRNTLRLLCVLEMALLTAFMFAGIVASPIEENTEAMVMLAGFVGAMAMGVHSACGRLLLRDLAPTAMMTGNVTQCVIEFIELIQKGGEKRRKRLSKYFWPIITFGLGALIAAFAYFQLGFWALLLPIAIVLSVACTGTGIKEKTELAPGLDSA